MSSNECSGMSLAITFLEALHTQLPNAILAALVGHTSPYRSISSRQALVGLPAACGLKKFWRLCPDVSISYALARVVGWPQP